MDESLLKTWLSHYSVSAGRQVRFTTSRCRAHNKLLTSISIRKKFSTKVISANLAPHFVSMAWRPESYASVPARVNDPHIDEVSN